MYCVGTRATTAEVYLEPKVKSPGTIQMVGNHVEHYPIMGETWAGICCLFSQHF